MDQAIATRPARLKALHDALATRILVLDGAMGTMIQRYRLDRGRSTAASASGISAATCAATTISSRSPARR